VAEGTTNQQSCGKGEMLCKWLSAMDIVSTSGALSIVLQMKLGGVVLQSSLS
jgi:hypothetical protein